MVLTICTSMKREFWILCYIDCQLYLLTNTKTEGWQHSKLKEKNKGKEVQEQEEGSKIVKAQEIIARMMEVNKKEKKNVTQ